MNIYEGLTKPELAELSLSSFAKKAGKVGDPTFGYGNASMEGAAVTFMLLALINWVMMAGKWFLYWWYVIDLPSIIKDALLVAGGAAGADTGSLAGLMSLVGSIDKIKTLAG